MERFQNDKGRPPTIREIGRAVGISSTSVVNYNLNILEKAGMITREKQVSRGLRLTSPNGHLNVAGRIVQIPLLGRIVAGKPVPVPEPGTSAFEGESVMLTRDLLPEAAENLYALHVKGDSMVDASIHDGDIVVMRHQKVAENGELVAVWLKNKHETTLKRFYREANRVRLQPANPNFDPIYAKPEHVEIQGKVVLVVRPLARVA
jgi:repressor LexA